MLFTAQYENLGGTSQFHQIQSASVVDPATLSINIWNMKWNKCAYINTVVAFGKSIKTVMFINKHWLIKFERLCGEIFPLWLVLSGYEEISSILKSQICLISYDSKVM